MTRRLLVIEEAHLGGFFRLYETNRDSNHACAARRGQLLVAYVIEQQRRHRVDVGTAATIELVLDHVEQTAMQTFDQRESFEIKRLNRRRRFISGRRHRLGCGFHHDTSPVVLTTYATGFCTA